MQYAPPTAMAPISTPSKRSATLPKVPRETQTRAAQGQQPIEDESQKREREFNLQFGHLHEKLIDHFSCACQTDEDYILRHGRMYISAHYICFSSQILGSYSKVVALKDVIDIVKRNTAYVIPNAMEVVTEDRKYFFTSFMHRDQVFDLVLDQWAKQRIKKPDETVSGVSTAPATDSIEPIDSLLPIVIDAPALAPLSASVSLPVVSMSSTLSGSTSDGEGAQTEAERIGSSSGEELPEATSPPGDASLSPIGSPAVPEASGSVSDLSGSKQEGKSSQGSHSRTQSLTIATSSPTVILPDDFSLDDMKSQHWRRTVTKLASTGGGGSSSLSRKSDESTGALAGSPTTNGAGPLNGVAAAGTSGNGGNLSPSAQTQRSVTFSTMEAEANDVKFLLPAVQQPAATGPTAAAGTGLSASAIDVGSSVPANINRLAASQGLVPLTSLPALNKIDGNRDVLSFSAPQIASSSPTSAPSQAAVNAALANATSKEVLKEPPIDSSKETVNNQPAEPPPPAVELPPIGKSCSHCPEMPANPFMEDYLSLPLKDVYTHLFSSKATFWRKAWEDTEATELVIPDWTNKNGCCLERDIKLRQALHQRIGPKSTRCEQKHVCRFKDEKTMLFFTESVMLDIPYADAFTVLAMWTLKDEGHRTKIMFHCEVKWLKSIWLKSAVQSGTLDGTRKFNEQWAQMAKRAAIEVSRKQAAASPALPASRPLTPTVGKQQTGSPKTAVKKAEQPRAAESLTAAATASAAAASTTSAMTEKAAEEIPAAAAAAVAAEETEATRVKLHSSLGATTTAVETSGGLWSMMSNLELPRASTILLGILMFIAVILFGFLMIRIYGLERELNEWKHKHEILEDRLIFLQTFAAKISANLTATGGLSASPAAQQATMAGAGGDAYSLSSAWNGWQTSEGIEYRLAEYEAELKHLQQVMSTAMDAALKGIERVTGKQFLGQQMPFEVISERHLKQVVNNRLSSEEIVFVSKAEESSWNWVVYLGATGSAVVFGSFYWFLIR